MDDDFNLYRHLIESTDSSNRDDVMRRWGFVEDDPRLDPPEAPDDDREDDNA